MYFIVFICYAIKQTNRVIAIIIKTNKITKKTPPPQKIKNIMPNMYIYFLL